MTGASPQINGRGVIHGLVRLILSLKSHSEESYQLLIQHKNVIKTICTFNVAPCNLIRYHGHNGSHNSVILGIFCYELPFIFILLLKNIPKILTNHHITSQSSSPRLLSQLNTRTDKMIRLVISEGCLTLCSAISNTNFYPPQQTHDGGKGLALRHDVIACSQLLLSRRISMGRTAC